MSLCRTCNVLLYDWPCSPSTPSSWVRSWFTTRSVTPVLSWPLLGAKESNSSKNRMHGLAACALEPTEWAAVRKMGSKLFHFYESVVTRAYDYYKYLMLLIITGNGIYNRGSVWCWEERKRSLTSGKHPGLPAHWLRCTYSEVQVPAETLISCVTEICVVSLTEKTTQSSVWLSELKSGVPWCWWSSYHCLWPQPWPAGFSLYQELHTTIFLSNGG